MSTPPKRSTVAATTLYSLGGRQVGRDGQDVGVGLSRISSAVASRSASVRAQIVTLAPSRRVRAPTPCRALARRRHERDLSVETEVHASSPMFSARNSDATPVLTELCNRARGNGSMRHKARWTICPNDGASVTSGGDSGRFMRCGEETGGGSSLVEHPIRYGARRAAPPALTTKTSTATSSKGASARCSVTTCRRGGRRPHPQTPQPVAHVLERRRHRARLLQPLAGDV